MINAESVADQEMMGLNAIPMVHCGGVHPQLHAHHWGKESEDYGCRGRRGAPRMPRERLVLGVQGEPHLPWEQRIDEHPDDCEHGEGGTPLGFFQPHRRDSGRGLHPAEPRLHRTLLVVIGLEELGIRP
jgi:hypothetical protein